MSFRLAAQISAKLLSYRVTISPSTVLYKRLSYYPTNDAFYGLDEDKQKLRETAFNFFQKELAPHAKDIDKTDNFPEMRNFWKKMGDLGFLGITAEPEYGGTGGSYLDQCLIAEEIARACGGVAVSYLAHASMCVNQLTLNATPEQKQKYLPKLCNGEHIGGRAMSEYEAGSDVGSIKLRAERKGDYYVLNGTKFWITNGSVADTLIVYGKTDMVGGNEQGITAFIVETATEGFKVIQQIDKLGMRGSPTCELSFENVKVPLNNILGKENKGVDVLMSGLNFERMGFAAIPIGLMQATIDTSFQYAHQRKQMGQFIGEFQLMQGKMADMFTTLNACRSYSYNVARACDSGNISSKDCAGVILYCGENGTQVALEGIQILGGNGYTNEYPAGRILRDAKLGEIGAGTSEIRRWYIGRQLNLEYK